MSSFKDSKGSIWDVELNVTNLKRVKSRLDIDIPKFLTDEFKPLIALQSDPVQLIDMLYVMCEDQCKSRSLNDEDFGRLFTGEIVADAQNAFEVALVNFFQKQAPYLKKILEKARLVTDKMHLVVDQKVEALDVDQIIQSIQKNSASK